MNVYMLIYCRLVTVFNSMCVQYICANIFNFDMNLKLYRIIAVVHLNSELPSLLLLFDRL